MGCSNILNYQQPSSGKKTSSTYPAPYKTPKSIAIKGTNLSQLLHQQLKSWQGTPYAFGGLNKTGIDCSGFIHVTFRDILSVTLPRTTESLAKTGTAIPRKQLMVGDLVFFKTGYFQRHVGIYVGDKQFIHASTSKGVMKSNLGSRYWAKHYWKSRRVISH